MSGNALVPPATIGCRSDQMRAGRKPKILFLNTLADPERGGGAEVVLWEQMRGLRDAGYACALLATGNEPGLRHTKQDGISVWRAGIRNLYWPHHGMRAAAAARVLWHALDSYNPLMQSYIRKVVAKEAPDVASLHNLSGWSAAAWATLDRLGLPSVQVLHDYYPICVKTTMYAAHGNCARQCAGCHLFRLPHRRLSRRLHAVVGVSRFILDRHRQLGFFDGVPIQEVIHNARAPSSMGLPMLQEEGMRKGIRFGFIGRLDEPKGIEFLLRAFLSANLADAELWVAGSGKYEFEQRLRAMVRDPRVRFLGQVTPDQFYPHSDVVVVPSLSNEALGMVVLEALAYGKPVIGARRGGIPEMIVDGENGLLFEPSETGQLEMMMKRLAGSIELRASMGRMALASAKPFLDTTAWIARYERLYNVVAVS